MNPLDEQLNRLCQAAAAARRPLPQSAPWALAERVLSRREASDEWLGLLPLMRRALVCACVVALVAAAFGYWHLETPASEESMLLESAWAMETLP